MPSLIKQLWGGTTSLVSSSQTLASLLGAKQPGSALPGLLVVADAFLGTDEATLVAKVEHQSAMRIDPRTTDDGHRVFVVEQLRELVFGDSARIYKIAVLSKPASSTGSLAGEVVDEQNRNHLAAYFLGKFMGMKLREAPAVLTQSFFERMTASINASSLQPEQKLDAQAAMMAQLNSNIQQVNPRQFIRDFVPTDHQSEMESIAQEQNVPLSPFPRDVSRVQAQIKRVRIDMENDIHVIAPAAAVGDGKPVQILDGEDGDTVVISGQRLRSVKGNGSR